MKENSPNQPIDPEIEARITALVLGELSPAQRTEMNRFIAQHPELQLLKKQIESAHKVLRSISSDEFPQEGDWKLSSEKRAAVLSVIEVKENEAKASSIIKLPKPLGAPIRIDSNWNLARVVAVIFIAVSSGLLGMASLFFIASPDSFQSAPSHVSNFSESRSVVVENPAGRGESFGLGTARGFDDGANDFVDNLNINPQIVFDAEGKVTAPQSGAAPVEPSEPSSSVFGGGGGGGGGGGDGAGKAMGAMETSGSGQEQSALYRSGSKNEHLDVFYSQQPEPVSQLPAITAPMTDSPVPSEPPAQLPNSTNWEGLSSQKLALQVPEVSLKAESSTPQVSENFEKRKAYSVLAPKVQDPFMAQSPSDAIVRSISPAKPKSPKSVEDSHNATVVVGRENAVPRGRTSEALGREIVESDKEAWWKQQAQIMDGQVEPIFREFEKGRTTSSRWSYGFGYRSYDEVQLLMGKAIDAPGPVEFEGRYLSLDEKLAVDEPFSTFSLHVSDVSFKLAQSSLSNGQWPEAAKIRIEEFVNAFDYGDPVPGESEKVACQVEQSVHPYLQQRNVMRVSMRTAATGRATSTPLRLTLLLDNSGSMERADRQETVRKAFRLLAGQLTAKDTVTLISFARQPRLLADKVVGDQALQLVSLIDQMPSEGGTNIEAALQLSLEKSLEQKTDDAQNRIVLLTDGAVNLGDANPENLSRMVTKIRDSGIAFDAAGINADGLNDEVLEALTRKGDGRYYLLDSVETADDRFAKQIAGALRPSAKNVKVQVEFNPSRVGRYKLLGFEKHLLNQEDFRNDKVDAAELAAAEAGVALYQFEARPDGEGDVGSVSVRFQDLSTGEMIEKRWPIPYEANAPQIDQATVSLRIATAAATLAAKLRGEPSAESVDYKTLAGLVSNLPQSVRMAKQVEQLQLMIQQSQQISGQ